jgi:Concanavalin A-like lectin/glucanases superfamily
MTIPTKYYTAIRRDSSIVGYWRLNDALSTGRALDWAAKYGINGIYDGKPSGNLPLISNDSSAGSKLFNESMQNIEIPDALPLRIIGDITIEMWMFSRFISQTCALFGKLNSSFTFASPFYCGLSSGELFLSLGNGISQTTVIYPSELLTGPINHIVVTSFRKNMSIFVNGEEKASKNLESQEIKDGGQPIFIGSLGNNTNRFVGLLGEISLYSAGFSAKKAKRHYEIGRQVLSEPSFIKTFDPPSYS